MTELLFTPQQFDPDIVFTSGQTFRFSKAEDGAWEGVAHGEKVRVTRTDDLVRFTAGGPASSEVWERYTDAARDYGALFEEPDDVLRAAIAAAPGLRVLRQEPFETLISFIISANNNIPRICGIIDRLCALSGAPIADSFCFPTPEQISSLREQDLRGIGAGYRARYIIESARMAADMDFEALSDLPYEKARAELLRFPGVGPKVADCILLFGLGKTEAFPVDVWMRRILQTLYGLDCTPAEMRAFAEERYGAAAGIAQQYLFCHARSVLPRGT